MKREGSRARLGLRAMEEILKSSDLLAPGCKRGRSRAVLLRPERASAASIEFLVRPGELIGERKSGLQPSLWKSGYRLRAPARCRMTPRGPRLLSTVSRPLALAHRPRRQISNKRSRRQCGSLQTFLIFIFVRVTFGSWVAAVPIFAIGAQALSY